MSEAIILVPGFFGFGQFGKSPTLDYFHGVIEVLTARRPKLAGRIVVHNPPPTGSLDERAASLHELVKDVLEGKRGFDVDRIHLVGHSTGGVDARLYANRGFSWVGGPEHEERERPLGRLGHVVTLSAPHAGTPIAENGAVALDVFLGLVYAATFTQRRLRWSDTGLLRDLARVLEVHAAEGTVTDRLLDVLAGSDPEARRKLSEFGTELVNDRQLAPNLVPEAMSERAAGLAATEHPRLHCYVSVSPPPRLFPDTQWLWRLVYSRAYALTTRHFRAGQFPGGPVIGGNVALRRSDDTPCDGVVPAASQTVDGNAAGIVEGDHLDVVGHFSGGDGGTVFKSDAAFDGARFRSLWYDIADRLDQPTALRSTG